MNNSLLRRYISEFVYGAVDGTVTTFAVVAASAGAGISSAVILILGLANLIADGFSMGASAYLAASSENEDSAHQTARRASPKIIGGATFGAFLLVGSVPVLPYLIDVIGGLELAASSLFYISAGATIVAFLAIGFVKGKVSEKNPFSSAGMTLLLGAIAASLAYVAGSVLAHLLGVDL